MSQCVTRSLFQFSRRERESHVRDENGNTHYLSRIIHKLYNLQHNGDADDEDIHGNVGESVIREELSKKGNIHGLCGQNPAHLVSRFLTHSNSNHYKGMPEPEQE